jgi:hypothetical protein
VAVREAAKEAMVMEVAIAAATMAPMCIRMARGTLSIGDTPMPIMWPSGTQFRSHMWRRGMLTARQQFSGRTAT